MRMDQWILIIPAIIVAAALLLQQAEGTEKLRSKREALNYEEPRVISSTNNDYDDNPSWGYAKPKLTCYSCYRSIDGEDCFTLKDTSRLIEQSCEGEQDQCMVHRLMENDELTTFKRGCAPSCKPGCRAAGVNFVYEECRSCCHDSLCNTGGGASSILPLKIIFTLFAVTTMILMIV